MSQAYRLDVRINSKVEQVESLNCLATKCTSTLSGMPRNPSGSNSRMEDIIIKIVDLQEEINRDIDSLVDLKKDIVRRIKDVDDTECQTLLEKRYLCFQPWEQIALDLGYSIQHTFRLHERALKKIVVPQEDESK